MLNCYLIPFLSSIRLLPGLAGRTGGAFSGLPSHKARHQATHRDRPNGFGQCRSESPRRKVSERISLSARCARCALSAKVITCDDSHNQPALSFSTTAVYQVRSSSQSASTRFPVLTSSVKYRRTSRINPFLGQAK